MNAKTTEILNASLEKGYKLDKYSFKAAGGHPFNHREYVIAFNKQARINAESKFSGLIDILRSETQTLLIQYIELTKKWAASDFTRMEALAATAHPNWDAYVNIGITDPAERRRIQDYEGQKRYRQAVDRRDAAKRIVEAGYEAYEAKEVRDANEHYESSLLKLAARIEKKGLDQGAIKVKTSHIGVNIETILTDGIKTVRAWTIIASGPIQKPHYRYLVK